MSKSGAGKARLDQVLVERGLADSLDTAQRLVMAGEVVVDDQRIDKPGTLVRRDQAVRVKDSGGRFVSRGGDKLHAALVDLGLTELVKGAVVLDVGASTGGFTDCCLQLGAKHVIALDVGTNQLVWSLRQDPRVTVLEGTDVRSFPRDAHPRPDLVVADVSFNSLARLAEGFVEAAPGAKLLLLVKPQFELKREQIPPGGVVEDPALKDQAVERVVQAFARLGLQKQAAVESKLAGRAGNKEIFLFLAPLT